MAVINILSPHVADMIAAGEVVERPGSVIKELMENAVDAGAKNITVELQGGGAVCIRVTDDGCGMAADDAGNCFLRHATSKLRDERGLEAISTMGFRGEALAAISAVSRIELLTRRKDDDEGTRVTVEGGEIRQMGSVGCPRGTSFTVRDLFYNTPARLKFMKSDRAEGAYCVQLAQRVAMGHPEISVRCVRDGKEEFFTAGDGKISSVVYALLGRDAALSMLPAEGENEGVRVRGFVSSPAAGRGNRAMQFFFVNGRAIRSAALQAALEQAYKNTLLVGRFPACVLFVELNAGAVDVNVHPTKSEVKFSGEKKVFDAVYYSVLNAVRGEEKTLRMDLSAGTQKTLGASRLAVPARSPAPSESDSRPVRPSPVAPPVRASAHAPVAPPVRRDSVPEEPFAQDVRSLRSPASNYDGAPVRREYTAPVSAPVRPEPVPKPVREPEKEPTQEPVQEQVSLFPPVTDKTEASGVRLVGEVMKTYIIAETGDTMLLIDKHAAHERMNFDRLKAAGRTIMSQQLLVSQPWHPTREDLEALEENRALMEELGFEIDAAGEDDLLIRGVPDTLDPAQAIPALEEICEKLRRGRRDLMRDEILQTISCKEAIKAGWDTDPAELRVLAEKVASGEIRYCPHGRPVAVALTRKDLDKQFKRIL